MFAATRRRPAFTLVELLLHHLLPDFEQQPYHEALGGGNWLGVVPWSATGPTVFQQLADHALPPLICPSDPGRNTSIHIIPALPLARSSYLGFFSGTKDRHNRSQTYPPEQRALFTMGVIAGKVTLDGEAIESGSITFQPIEGTQSPSAGTAVTQGVYQIPLAQGPLPGVYRVEIYAQRKTGNKLPAGSPAPPGTLVDEVVEAVPGRFNAQSTLRAEVRPGNNPLDFNLSST